MKAFKQNLLIPTLALVLITMLVTPSSQQANDDTTEPVKLVINNDIPGEKIDIHCYSDDGGDLGYRTLAAGANFTSEFISNVPPILKYYCELISSHGSGNYEVFSRVLEAYECNQYCLWSVQVGGPCLQKTEKDVDCKSWKIPPSLRNKQANNSS